jgi:hypothetical protein
MIPEVRLLILAGLISNVSNPETIVSSSDRGSGRIGAQFLSR